MRNQPHSQWQVIDSAAEQREEAWDLDRRTGLRTTLLWVGVCVILSITGLRLFDVKANHRDDFLANAHPTTRQIETIPAMDGRIYSSDGQLLAYDDQLFGLAVHYRWLQEPSDPGWLKQQARKRLTSRKKRDEQAIKIAQNEVLALRKKLWSRLTILSGKTEEQLSKKRNLIQQRVERIAQTVRENQKVRFENEKAKTENDTSIFPNNGIGNQIWRLVKSELTQAPRRRNRDPIIIREELDYHLLVDHLTTLQVAEIESQQQKFPGTRIITQTRRIYPQGSLASHVIGLRRALRADQIQKRKDELQIGDPLSYQTGDRQGESGVEKTYDITLRGLPGERELTKNRRGEIIETTSVRDSRSGNHLVLSLHSELQQTAEKLLDKLISTEESLIPPAPSRQIRIVENAMKKNSPTGGCILVMNVYSGELLAAASAPRPNLSLMSSSEARYWKQLTTDKRSPLLSRITQMAIPPGSTFKALTAIAFCESQGIPNETITCKGYLDTPSSHRCAIFRNAGVGHGEIGLVDAISQSCNVYFFNAARKMGEASLVEMCKRFEFGKLTGADLPFEKRGHIPSPADNSPSSKYHWYPGDNLGLAIGQSYFTVTPLQMVRMTAAIANGGELVTPHLVSRILPGEIDSQSSVSPSSVEELSLPSIPLKNLAISPATLSIVQEGLEQSVESSRGTAHKTVAMKQISIAGKTGTAQTGIDREPHAWFIGYAPAKKPRYAFVILLQNGGSGGKNAGPLAKEIVKKLLELDLISE